MDIQSPDSLVDYFHHFADHLAFPFRTKPVGVGTIEAFSSAFFRRLPEIQFRARLCDSGQAPPRVEAQVVNDLTPPFVRFHFAAQSESHYIFSLHRFRASQRDMKAPPKIVGSGQWAVGSEEINTAHSHSFRVSSVTTGKSTTKKRRARRKNRGNLRVLRFFVVAFHFSRFSLPPVQPAKSAKAGQK